MSHRLWIWLNKNHRGSRHVVPLHAQKGHIATLRSNRKSRWFVRLCPRYFLQEQTDSRQAKAQLEESKFIIWVLTEDKNNLSAFSPCPSIATHLLFLKNKSQHLFKLTLVVMIGFNISNWRSSRTVIIISSLFKEAVTWKV